MVFTTGQILGMVALTAVIVAIGFGLMWLDRRVGHEHRELDEGGD